MPAAAFFGARSTALTCAASIQACLNQEAPLDFAIPDEIRRKLAELDAFIEREIAPLEREHPQYFDHRREHARTDWDNGGRPRHEWEALLGEMAGQAFVLEAEPEPIAEDRREPLHPGSGPFRLRPFVAGRFQG